MRSHPTWVCGLKLYLSRRLLLVIIVTPYVGVWIETRLVGPSFKASQSHPTWVCGLKQARVTAGTVDDVTPYVGVWIETLAQAKASEASAGHTLRGCVD